MKRYKDYLETLFFDGMKMGHKSIDLEVTSYWLDISQVEESRRLSCPNKFEGIFSSTGQDTIASALGHICLPNFFSALLSETCEDFIKG